MPAIPLSCRAVELRYCARRIASDMRRKASEAPGHIPFSGPPYVRVRGGTTPKNSLVVPHLESHGIDEMVRERPFGSPQNVKSHRNEPNPYFAALKPRKADYAAAPGDCAKVRMASESRGPANATRIQGRGPHSRHGGMHDEGYLKDRLI